MRAKKRLVPEPTGRMLLNNLGHLPGTILLLLPQIQLPPVVSDPFAAFHRQYGRHTCTHVDSPVAYEVHLSVGVYHRRNAEVCKVFREPLLDFVNCVDRRFIRWHPDRILSLQRHDRRDIARLQGPEEARVNPDPFSCLNCLRKG